MKPLRAIAVSLCCLGLGFLGLATRAAAELVKLKDWEKSPEFVYLATDAEKKEWKAIKTDEEGQKFVDLFWAKRDPELKTPVNEYKQRFDALVQKADENFELGKKRGALTDRGKLLILLGPPKSLARSQGTGQDMVGAPSLTGSTDVGSGSGTVMGGRDAARLVTTYVFHYEQAQLPEWTGLKTLDVRFQVDSGTLSEMVLDVGPFRKLTAKAVQVALAHPELKTVPVYKTAQQVAAEQKAAADAAAEAAKGPVLSEGVRKTLEAALAKEAFGPVTLMALAYRDGATRLMAQIFAPASEVPAPEGVELALLVRDKAGKDAARREEPAALSKAKADSFADRSLPVPPGDYDVAMALMDAAGAVLVSGKGSVTVSALPTELAASSLLVAAADFPADGQKPDEPFSFSVRKFVARGEGRLEKSDGLSYAMRLYNPSVDAATKKMLLKRIVKIKPKGGAPIDVPQPPEEPAPAPEYKDKGAVVVDLAGGIVESNLGDYFRPGEYTLKVTIVDGEKRVEAQAPFTVVGPAAPPPPPPAPKKKK